MQTITRLFSILVLLLALATLGYSLESHYSVKDFGAMGDGSTMETKAIQKAIDEANKNGGGVVYFPAGRYLSGTIYLKDNVTLHISSGAVLLGSKNKDDYPQNIPAIRSYTDNYVSQSLIAGENLENIGIRGRGTIDGNGAAFDWRGYGDRPYLIRLVGCKRILVEDIHLTNSAMWMQHYLACDYITIRGISVYNHVTYNNDGLDLDGCRYVTVSDCVFDSDDDALCLKSTLDRPSENITITNCILSSHCNAFKMGTESNGGFKNISVSNCTIRPPGGSKSIYGEQRGLAGIALEIVDGGIMDRIAISNITMTGITTPIFLRLGNRARPFKKDGPKPGVGTMRNITLNNIVATGASKIGCSITGLPGHPIENVNLSNIRLHFEGGGTKEDAQKDIPEKEASYPESKMFGVLPAYGFYCRHVENLTFDNMSLAWEKNDERPAMMFDDVKHLGLYKLVCQNVPPLLPTILFRGIKDAFIQGCRAHHHTDTFLRVEGKSERISLVGNDLSQVKTPVELDNELNEEILFLSDNRND